MFSNKIGISQNENELKNSRFDMNHAIQGQLNTTK